MTNEGLEAWLRERGVGDEAIKGVIQSADDIKTIYADLIKSGAAMPHEDWIDDITSDLDGTTIDQVVWFLVRLAGGPISYIQLSEGGS